MGQIIRVGTVSRRDSVQLVLWRETRKESLKFWPIDDARKLFLHLNQHGLRETSHSLGLCGGAPLQHSDWLSQIDSNCHHHSAVEGQQQQTRTKNGPKIGKITPQRCTIFTNKFLYQANYIFLGIDILQERIEKLCEENVIAQELLRDQAKV